MNSVRRATGPAPDVARWANAKRRRARAMVASMCTLKESLLSMVTPRSFIFVVCVSGVSSIFRTGRSKLAGRRAVQIIEVHFERFNGSRLRLDQETILFKSFCKERRDWDVRIGWMRVTSSAYSRGVDSRLFVMSLMKMLKNTGPRTEPCGTPE